jgi:hypothetical protein
MKRVFFAASGALFRDYASQLKTGVDSANLISTSYGIALADAGIWLSDMQWSHDRRCPAAAIQRVVTALHSQGILESPDADLELIWQQL